MNENQEAKLAHSERVRYSCYYMCQLYGKRAEQLTGWKRILDFIGLGVTPGIIMAVADKPSIRVGGLVLSGLCSLAAYVWTIFGYAFHRDRQLEVSRDAESSLRSLFLRMRDTTAIASDPSSDSKAVERSLKALEGMRNEYEKISKDITDCGVTVKPWMQILAMQQTMLDEGTICRVCRQSWDGNKHKFLTAKEARQLIKEDDPSGCKTCGLTK